MVLLRYCVDGSAAIASICKVMMAEIRSAKEEVAAGGGEPGIFGETTIFQ